MRFFSDENKVVLERIQQGFFPSEARLLPIHILDLAADGVIGSHVDNIEYSGRIIVGLSLLSDAVMSFSHESSGKLAQLLFETLGILVTYVS